MVLNKRHLLGTVLVVAVAAAACDSSPTITTPALTDSCEPTPQQSPAAMVLERLPGAYQIVFVVTEGGMSGHTAVGRLILRAQDPVLVRITAADTSFLLTQPVIGQIALALDSIGATHMGDPMSADPAMPGVGFYVTRLSSAEVTGVIARVGAGSNVRGQVLFDAGYFTLFIQGLNIEGIRGTWRSSAGTAGLVTPEARGYFCAARLATG